MRKYSVHYIIYLAEADWQSQDEIHRHTEFVEARTAQEAGLLAMKDDVKKEVLRKLYPAFHDKLNLSQINVFCIHREALADVWVCAEQVY